MYYSDSSYNDGTDPESYEFGPYEDEGYSKKPIPGSDTRVGNTHHDECGWLEGDDFEKCSCKDLFNRDYEVERDKEAEDLHEEWWQ